MSQQHYHRLADGNMDEEADAVDATALLWDQLNDEQSREVQQHQSRFQVADPRQSRTNHWVIVQSMAWNTLIRTGASASSAWHAAQEAWRNHPSVGRGRGGSRQYHGGNAGHRPTDLDFDEQFGISDLRPTSFSEIVEGGDNDDEASSRHRNGGTTRRNDNNINNNNTGPRGTSRRDERPNPGYPFVVLQQYPSRQAVQREQEHWGIVANMDVFLQNLYQYYYHRGLVPMVCKFLVEFVSLIFTLWLSRILMQRVDWQELTTCKDEHTCKPNWSDYYYDPASLPTSSYSYPWLVRGYTILFLAYAAFSVWTFWQSLQQAWKCQYIMHEKLGISRRKLQGGSVSWDAVVQQLIQAQDSGIYRTTLSRLDPLVIAQRILRKENFLLAFFNQKSSLLDIQIGQRQYWCPTLEWSIHVCVLNFMFNHKYELRPAFVLDAAALERRLIVCGIVHIILLPFLMMFLSLHFLFRNVYDLKTSKQYMGGKQWSTVALWTFREFNELPHVLERRLEPSYGASEDYLKLFGQSEWQAALGKLLVFLGGAVGGVLLVLGVLNDAILLHVQLWGRNLLWYAGMAGIVYSVGKGLLPTKEAQPSVTRNLFADMDAALKTVSTHTHYYPEHWKGRGWDPKVHSQFGMMFDSKVKLFLWELISLVLAPYILIAKLSKCAPAICEFCMTIKAKVPGAGDVCGYSTFDFDTFKDEAWDGKTLGQSTVLNNNNNNNNNDNNHNWNGEESLAESILRTGNLEEATRQHPKPKSRDGKMEKSFFGFQAAHPSWKCSPSGQSLVDRVEEYKQAELAALSRERNLYIDAAARQLETLVEMEREDAAMMKTKHYYNYPAAAGASTTFTTSDKMVVTYPKTHKFEQEQFRDLHYDGGTPDGTDDLGNTLVGTADDADAGTHPSPRMGPVPPPPAAFALNSLHNNIQRRNSSSVHSTSASAATLANSSSLPFANNNNNNSIDEADQGSSSLAPPPSSASHITGNANRSTVPSQQYPSTRPPTTPAHYHHPDSQQLASSTTTNTTTVTTGTATTAASTNRDALRAGLSTELRRLLTLSTLESGENGVLAGANGNTPPSLLPGDDDFALASTTTTTSSALGVRPDYRGTNAGSRQYYWLERFHEHLEQEHQQHQQGGNGVAAAARMTLSTPMATTTTARMDVFDPPTGSRTDTTSSTTSVRGRDPLIARSMPIPGTHTDDDDDDDDAAEPSRTTNSSDNGINIV